MLLLRFGRIGVEACEVGLCVGTSLGVKPGLSDMLLFKRYFFSYLFNDEFLIILFITVNDSNTIYSWFLIRAIY